MFQGQQTIKKTMLSLFGGGSRSSGAAASPCGGCIPQLENQRVKESTCLQGNAPLLVRDGLDTKYPQNKQQHLHTFQIHKGTAARN